MRMPNRGSCDDLRIVDLSSGRAGGLATMVLADFGADVLKVEPPGGDPRRSDAAAPMWLRGKRSVVLDLARQADRGRLHDLVSDADVVVASFAPGEAEGLGADYATLEALNPGLVYCSITGWGPRGPYAHYPVSEGLVAAKSGRMQNFAGLPQRAGPAYAAVPVGTHGASQSALSGILAGLLVRDRTGRGQLVETSLLQGLFPFDTHGLVRTQLARRFPSEFAVGIRQTAAAGRITLQYLPAIASDGRWIQFANLMEHLFHAMIAAADLSHIYSDPRFALAPNTETDEDREALRGVILERIRERPADEWMEIFRADGNVASEPFETTQEALGNIDLRANGEVSEDEHPRLGRLVQLGPLARLRETPGRTGGPSADPGAHQAQLFAASNGRRAPRRAEAPPFALDAPAHALEGVTVLEFATVIAAPLGASLLADLGARVIKIESLEGDPYRYMGQGFGQYTGATKTTAGKESICLDLKTAEGQAIAQRLVRDADVLIHNYRPGVAERLGIGYDELSVLRPELVYLAATGYGPDGPSASRPAAHPIPGAAMGGALHQAGSGMPPTECDDLDEIREASRWLYVSNEANPDPNTSVAIASSALLGLYARRRTGRGQRIDLSMLAANAYANSDDFLSYEGKPERLQADPELYGPTPLRRLYETGEGWVYLEISHEREWQALTAALPGLGGPDLAADPRFATPADREREAEALAALLGEAFAARGADEWERELIAAGAPCVRADVPQGEFLRDDEHMRANGFAPEVEHAVFGRYQRSGPTVTLSRTPGRYGPGVLAGQHSDAILAELGYSAEAIEELRRTRVTASEEPKPLPE
ncbi:MAG: CoA transferase [Chloroflexi bacterium]|nr:CoA transferase [Chloroflexota bacterium]